MARADFKAHGPMSDGIVLSVSRTAIAGNSAPRPNDARSPNRLSRCVAMLVQIATFCTYELEGVRAVAGVRLGLNAQKSSHRKNSPRFKMFLGSRRA